MLRWTTNYKAIFGVKIFFYFFFYIVEVNSKNCNFFPKQGQRFFELSVNDLNVPTQKKIYIYINLFNKLLQITGSRLADMAKSHCALPVSDCVQNRTSDG